MINPIFLLKIMGNDSSIVKNKPESFVGLINVYLSLM